jgi:hypothetical protein
MTILLAAPISCDPSPSASSKSKPACTGRAAAAREAITVYAECLFEGGDIIEIRRIPWPRREWCLAGELPGKAAKLYRANGRGQNIYLGANPRRFLGGSKNADISCCRAIVADFDDIDPAEAQRRWHAAGLPAPTLTITSGHGVHCYWRLTAAVWPGEWTATQRRLAAVLRSDGRIHDPARIMRLPGLLNVKDRLSPVPCMVFDCDSTRRYDFETLQSLLRAGLSDHCPTSPNHTLLVSSGQVDTVLVSSGGQPGSVAREEMAADLVEQDLPGFIAKAIELTQPTSIGQRHNAIFDLARTLKGRPELSRLSADDVREYVLRWHERALPVIGTKPFSTTWNDFQTSWRNVKYPKGATLGAIFAKARKLNPPASVAHIGDDQLSILASACGLLAKCGQGSFWLGCREAGRCLGCSREWANQLLRRLGLMGIIRVAKKGTRGSNTEYLYLE